MMWNQYGFYQKHQLSDTRTYGKKSMCTVFISDYIKHDVEEIPQKLQKVEMSMMNAKEKVGRRERERERENVMEEVG